METGSKSLRFTEPPRPDGRIKNPTGQGRARTVYRNGKTWHYTPGESVKVRDLITYQWIKQHGAREPWEGPIWMHVRVWFPRPKSHFCNKPHPFELKENAPIFPIVKPDFDNLEKLASDALKGVAFHDDAQIIRASFEKQYLDVPAPSAQWEITIWELAKDGSCR